MRRIAELLTVRRLLVIGLIGVVVMSCRNAAVRKAQELAARPWGPEKCLAMMAGDDAMMRSYAIDDLMLSGPAAIEYLIRGAKLDDDLVSGQCLDALVQCLYDDAPEINGTAIDAFHTLSAEARIMVAVEARNTLAKHEARVLECCIDAIEQVGGMVRYFQREVGDDRPQIPAAVVLGPDWHGEDSDLQWLNRMPVTTTLFLVSGDEVSPAGLALLGETRPDVLVQQRGPTCIGLTLREGLVIMAVEPDSPAARAGLMLEEHVRQINGVSVDSFEDFISAIAHRKPGEVIEITLQSQGQLREVSLELGTDLLSGACECVTGEPMNMGLLTPNT